MIAEARHIGAVRIRDADDHLALARLHRHAVDLDVDEFLSHDSLALGQLHPRLVDDAAAAVIDHVFELVPVVLEEALHRPGRRIAERADGVAFDAVGDVEQQVQLLAPRRPASTRRSSRFIQPVPSRHGVHWPQDSDM